MGPRPFEIFQKISPSLSPWTAADVQLAGLTGRAAAAGPSPPPLAPWQATQLASAIFLASAITLSDLATGFFTFFASGGATHLPWAQTPAPSARTATTATTPTVNPNQRALMFPPLIGLPSIHSTEETGPSFRRRDGAYLTPPVGDGQVVSQPRPRAASSS